MEYNDTVACYACCSDLQLLGKKNFEVTPYYTYQTPQLVK